MIDNNCLGLIFANMHDNSLGELTQNRTTGSVPFGGRYRMIDFALSNMVNSGISTVGVITKHNFASLMDHLGTGRNWDLARKRGGLVMLPPYGRPGTGVYQGRLDALCNAKGFLKKTREEYVVLSDAHVIANIDLSAVLDFHKSNDADITVVYKEMETSSLGGKFHTVEINKNRIEAVLERVSEGGNHKVSLEIFVMKRELVLEICKETEMHALCSLTKDYLRPSLSKLKVCGYNFEGYAEMIGSQKNYYDANMRLLTKKAREELFNPQKPVYTKVRDDFPASYGLSATASGSLIADGCIIEGRVENSVLFRGVTVEAGAVVRNSILMQGTKVGKKAELNFVIADKNVVIGENTALSGSANYPVYFAKGKTV